MNKAEDGKKYYDNIEIPSELSKRVEDAIASADRGKAEKKVKNRKIVRLLRYTAAAAAGMLVCMTIGLNTNEVFAKEMSELPVIGSLAKVLTIRSYHEKDRDHNIAVKIPEIQVEQDMVATGEAAVNDVFIGDINAEIQKIVDEFVADAKVKFAEYKKAFFDTGGTEEEWNDRDILVNVDYEVKYQNGNILSLVLITDEAWVSAYGVRYYYNLDLSTNRQLTLQDILGDNYVQTANESIIRQMQERVAGDEMQVFWGIGDQTQEDMIEGFQSVDDTTRFYLNDKGNPVVCFDKYEVAPGYMGMPEFEIEKIQSQTDR